MNLAPNGDAEALLAEKDRQIEELRKRIDELEFDLQELVDPL